MAVHFIHVGKAGGTAVRHTLRSIGADTGLTHSPWGPIFATPRHNYTLHKVPRGDKAIIPLRDPLTRFVSGFYSRQRKGQPRHFREWTDQERQSFEWFETPDALADALAQPSGEARSRAEYAMRSIRQLRRHMTHWTGTPAFFRNHLDKVLYVARQETLDEDWERIKELLGLPPELMLLSDPVAANRTTYPRETVFSEHGAAALKRWYAKDYEVLELGERFRSGELKPSRRLVPRPSATQMRSARVRAYRLRKRLRRRAARLRRAI
jgi:hypothetical protein